MSFEMRESCCYVAAVRTGKLAQLLFGFQFCCGFQFLGRFDEGGFLLLQGGFLLSRYVHPIPLKVKVFMQRNSHIKFKIKKTFDKLILKLTLF